jgi:hypothetical protein
MDIQKSIVVKRIPSFKPLVMGGFGEQYYFFFNGWLFLFSVFR